MIDCLPICCVRCVYKYRARRRPLYQVIHLFLATLLRCRRLPHPVFDVPSVSGEQAPKPMSPRIPARCRGHIRFLGSDIATARWMSSSHYADVRRSPSTVFVFFLFFLRVDRSFLLLALDPVNLIQIVVLVLIHISVIHVVSLFLVVGINLCIAKLLLFPTIT